MQSVKLTLETVTPLFLGGADQQPELRPASVRGALRYWLRAALGGVIGDNDLDELRRREAEVFGKTEQGSAVVVRVSGTLSKIDDFDLDRDGGRQLRSGHNYFYYSTRLGENRRVPFAPGQPKAVLTLSTRPGVENASNILQKAAASAWLLTHLGGLGMRARRCGGSMQVVEGDFSGLPEFVISASAPQNLKTHLVSGLKQVCAAIGTLQSPSREFDVLHPDVCRVWVITEENPWRTWKDAVNAMGKAMQGFRAERGADRNRANSIFGVPILHGPSYGLQRRASPLWLRVTKLSGGQYVGVATLFKSDFKEGAHEVGGGYAHIESFLKTFPVCLEVDYR